VIPGSPFKTVACHALEVQGSQPSVTVDSEAFRFFDRAFLAAQCLRMRSDIARRFAGVSRLVPSRRLRAGSFGFAGRITLAGLDDVSMCAAVDGLVASVLTAARLGGAAGAMSMPNISERSCTRRRSSAARPRRGSRARRARAQVLAPAHRDRDACRWS